MNKKHFLYASTILLGLMTQSASCMEHETEEPDRKKIIATKGRESSKLKEGREVKSVRHNEHSLTSGKICPSNVPNEILAHIFSYLEQNNLLRAGRVSKTWRQAAEKVWETKPLDLSNRRLDKENYMALANGPFPSLILQKVQSLKDNVCIIALSSRFTHLNLSENRIGDEGAASIAAARFPLLTTLNLSFNSIGAEGAGKLSTAHFPLLTTLNLSFNSIGDEGAGKLASANFPLLTTLYLSVNRIGGEGAGKLASANFPLLTALYLSVNSIGDEGAGKLASTNFPLLRTLNLSGNNIGDEGAGKLASANFPLLTALDLSSNPIGNKRKEELERKFGEKVFF